MTEKKLYKVRLRCKGCGSEFRAKVTDLKKLEGYECFICRSREHDVLEIEEEQV
jgi:DNA-directed RNA polymerase subunit RPC12/RpoP